MPLFCETATITHKLIDKSVNWKLHANPTCQHYANYNFIDPPFKTTATHHKAFNNEDTY